MSSLSRRASVLLVTAGAVLASFSTRAQAPWRLITPDEEARDNATPEGPVPPDLPPPPAIDLVRPDISGTVRNPVTIEVRFRAGSGETIDMRTFNATYGRLGINITGRLLAHAVTTPDGLSADNVELPSGSHRVTLSIADTSGKRASRTFRFSVAR
jgi:hypothetical protein